jgi:acyl-CoA synthetase (NDP forming)
MTPHRLTPLLNPKSVAVIGASQKEDSYGHMTISQVRRSGFQGPVYAVNPNYDDVIGYPCVSAIAETPEPVEHAVMVVANSRIEAAIAEVIRAGVKSITLMASGYLEGDSEPKLTERITDMANEAGLLICGGNCLGFYNFENNLHTNYARCEPHPPGNVAFISHSGAIFLSIAGSEPRMQYNLAVSAGQELNVNAADYLDYMVDMPSTKAVAMIIETVRNPELFVAALEKAQDRDIAVVAIKIGRTERSAAMAKTHSGALAGNDAAYEALFDHYGVIRASGVAELTGTAQVLATGKRAGNGGLISLHDSGGSRGLAIDTSHAYGLRYAEISEATTAVLADHLEYGLEPVNPVDLWATGQNWLEVVEGCYTALINDPDTAAGMYCGDYSSGHGDLTHMVSAIERTAAQTTKPAFIVQPVAGVLAENVLAQVHAGMPIIDGIDTGMQIMRGLFWYRDYQARHGSTPPPAPADAVVAKWRARLATGANLDEAESLTLFADFAIAVPDNRVVTNEAELSDALDAIGYPVVLKTAEPGIDHKSDVGGVHLGLGSEAATTAAYRDLHERLGPRAIVSHMTEATAELSFGIINDAQFGPLVMVATGGVLIELFEDRKVAMPPVSQTEARRLIDGLRGRKMLDGLRGKPAADIAAAAASLARFSVLAHELGDLITEADANPILCTADGAFAADGLVMVKDG